MDPSARRSPKPTTDLRLLLVTCAITFVFANVTNAQRAPIVPSVDLTKHSVPLEAIYFDTFQRTNRAVPLAVAPQALIERLRDAIPPLHRPKYESPSTVSWLSDNDMVIGYAAVGEAWAYPLRILNYHEIVNDTLAGEPLVVAYCPLCGSGVVFSRRLQDRLLTFGNTSALYESDMVMLDYETGSYWWHVAGKAIVGTLTGTHLSLLPAMTTTWGQWRRMHTNTKVLSQETGYRRPYGRDPFVGYPQILNRGRFAFPVSNAAKDGRLPPGTSVLAVKMGDDARAYALDRAGPATIMDVVGGQRLVVLIDARGISGAIFEPVAGTQKLTFQTENGEYVDRETGSAWNLGGQAIKGALKGTQLPPLPSKRSFWFAVVAAQPTITVYSAGAD
jgi:hypothetical protein